MEGTLQEGTLYRALGELARKETTGILTVQGEEEIIAFSLLRGEIVSADALNQTLEETLGELLVKRQLVSADDFGGLAAEYQAGGGRVIDLLVERSYLSRAQLLDVLREHTYRLCLEAFTWVRGEYRFYKGEEVAFEEGFRPLGIDELAVRVTLDLGPSGPLSGGVPGAGAVLHRVSGDGPVSGQAVVAPHAGALSPDLAERIWDQIDGRRSLEAVAAAAGVSLYQLQHLVHLWVGDGLVTTTPGKPSVERRGTTPEEPVALSGEEGAEPEPVSSVDLLELDPGSEAPPPAAEGAAEVAAPSVELPLATPWPARAMGLGLWLAVLFLLFAQPARLLLPFPWQGGLRDAYEKQQRAVLHHKIEQAANTFFLLNGRFPEEMEELESLRLLSPRDLRDPNGRDLVMTSATASYLVEASGESLGEESALTGTIAGNILLDPEFRLPEEAGEPPLVLLD